ncbi:tetratricopeptide repeat protein [aff. Roholtiella sp. LEGE 12411]|nr:tetratricopeptide repeat protein [aff. Roholtiella sp. LEGE 12411]
MIPVIAGLLWWLRMRHRQRRIPPSTFPFQVIKPQSQDVLQRILGGDDNDPLADRNIAYQVRVANCSVRQELKQLLEKEESRWVLILGQSGLGKTREATELANHLNQEGWTVLFLKPGEWLDFPAQFPTEIGTDRKLLFFLDDLNQKMLRGREEISPEAEKNPVEQFRVPLQQRLLQALEKYEKFCGKAEIRVIATARNERISDFEGESTHWDKLQWERYPQLWNRFTRYELAKPEDDAIIELFSETIPNTNISAKVEDYPALARRNDRTFRNVVENLRTLKNNQQPLNLKNYRDTLKDTWEERYKKAVRKYPASRYIYDAVDLLQKFDIELQRFTVEATARMLVGGNFWQQLRYWWQIRIATNLLIHSERILKPCNGQIEAKAKQVEAGEHILRLSRLLLKLAERYPTQMQESLVNFGNEVSHLGRYKEALVSFDKALKISRQSNSILFLRDYALHNSKRKSEALTYYSKVITIKADDHEYWYNEGNTLYSLGKFEEAIASYNKAIEIKPDFHKAWFNIGLSLDNLGRKSKAIASYKKAIEYKPDLHEAWYNIALLLSSLGRESEAIASYKKAIEIKPDLHESWNNHGNILSSLGRKSEAIASYDQAIKIKPDYHKAWYNRSNILSSLGRKSEAIASYDKAIELKPNLHEAWNNRGYTLSNLGRFEQAIASYDKAIEIKLDKHEAWNNRGYTLSNLGRFEQAIASYDKAIELKPDLYQAWYGKACCYGLQSSIEQAIYSLQQAINLNPEECRERVKTDSDFDSIRNDEQFQSLLRG